MRRDAARERERERGGGGGRGARGERGDAAHVCLSLFLSFSTPTWSSFRSISDRSAARESPLVVLWTPASARRRARASEEGREKKGRRSARSPPHPPTHPPSFLPADDSARARARVRRDAFVIFSPDRSRGYARRSLLPERNSGNCCRLGELSAACRRRATRRAAKRNIE